MRLKIKDMFLILLLNFLFIIGFNFINNIFSWKWISNSGVISVLVLILVLFLFKFNFKEFKNLKKGNLKEVFYVILLFFPIAFIGRLVAPEFDTLFANNFGLIEFNTYLIFMLLSFFILLKEEIIERVSQLKFSKAYGSRIGITALSLNFAFLHFNFNFYLGSIIVISVFFGSLILSSFYERTRNFPLTFLIHLFYNFLIVMQIFLHLNNINLEWIFWGIYGILFLIFFNKSWANFIEGFNRFKIKKPSLGDLAFLLLFVLLPLLISLIY